MIDQDDALLLNAEKWLAVVDNSELGEEIPAPLGMSPFMKGAVTTLGAATRVGKTALGLQCFRLVAEAYNSAYCTLEMSPALLFKRFWPQFGSEEECREWVQTYDPYISRSYLEYHELEEVIRRGFDFVVIDHIHELPMESHEDLGRKVKRIQGLAAETNTAILMLSQMKQPSEFDTGPPTIYDYSWTKAIPEVSSVCYAIWRPEENTPDVELVHLKNRFGPEYASKTLVFDKELVIFRERF